MARIKYLSAVILGVALGIGGARLAWKDSPKIGSRQSVEYASYIYPDAFDSGAKELVKRAIEQETGYDPQDEIGCPWRVRNHQGAEFRCEALVRGYRIPVTLEVASATGFLRVKKVGR